MAQHSSKDPWTAKLTATDVKLNDTNYLHWVNAFEIFLAAHIREHHITNDPPDSKVADYAAWYAADCAIISWIINSVEEHITRTISHLRPVKRVWDTIYETYGNEQNISRVCEVYKQLFSLRQNDGFVSTYYTHIRSLLEELEVHQPFVADVAVMKRYREELTVAIFPAGLCTDLASQIRGQILGADTVSSL